MGTDDRLKRAEELHLGGPTSDNIVILCIYGDDIDLQAISTMLGCEPTEAHRRGEEIGKRKRPATIGLWSVESPTDLSFEDKLEYLVKSTTPEHKTWDALAATHRIKLNCTIFLHSWTEGFEIPTDLLAEIGNRHWQFGLSMYSAEGEEILESFLRPTIQQED